jgi:hypothetical protein
LGFLDPWVAFPALARQTAGLQKQVSVPARPRVGLTIVMLKAIEFARKAISRIRQ